MPGWTFDSFSPAALERLFSEPSAEQRAALAALGREAAERALGRRRLSYEGLALRERVALDAFVKALFDDAGLAPAIERRRHPIPPLDDEEIALVADASDLDEGGRLLRLLVAGRRLGSPDVPVGGTYVVFEPAEAQDLLYALRTALGRGALDPATTALVRSHLVPALERTGRDQALYAALPADDVEAFDHLLTAGETNRVAKGSAQHARYQLLVQGDVDGALATLAALAGRAGPVERERTLAELVDLCVRYGRLDDAQRWRTQMG